MVKPLKKAALAAGAKNRSKKDVSMIKAPAATTGRLLYGWLFLAVFSLVFAGVFALLVALARTPVMEDLLPLGRDYIYVALVGHVDLAVVIWFLAFEGFLWALTSTVDIGKKEFSPILGMFSVYIAGAGIGLVVIAAVFALGPAEIANYVPVLLTPVFFAGLVLFAVGILLSLVNTFLSVLKARAEGQEIPAITFGMVTAGVAVFVAILCFGLSAYFQVSTGKAFIDFERLFWGGGHILQYANTIAMVAAWTYLARLIYGRDPFNKGFSKLLYAFYLLFIIPAPFIFFMYDTSSAEYKAAFTFLMQWGMGWSTSIFGLGLLWMIIREKRSWKDPAFASLVLSMSIFLTGGLIGIFIRGVNTIIPAHYHCVIGAVTIAFMGLFYELMPVVGRELYSKRLAALQPYLYSLGILLFAVGLFYAGTHGVARKTYGSEQNLNSMAKVMAMSIMGIGGLVAIAGGITFVWNAIITLFRRSNAQPDAIHDTEIVRAGKY